jgi:hypothetical protein
MKAHAGPRNWMQIIRSLHQVGPSSSATGKRFSVIRYVFRVTTVKKRTKTILRSRPAREATDGPTNARECSHVIVCA